jgi:transposase
LWLGAAGFVVVDARVVHDEIVVVVETAATRVACGECGVVAVAKDRRTVRLRDVPVGERPVIIEWRKRVWACAERECGVRSWTEQRPDFALERRVLTVRAGRWVCDRVSALEGTTASCARRLGVSWPTAWTAIVEHGQRRVDDPDRVGPCEQIGFDETVFTHARRGRRRTFVTAAVDTSTGQIIDVFEGRDSADLGRWLARQPAEWCGTIGVVSVDPHEGYRNALIGSPYLSDVTVVVDPFHIVRLANQCVTRCRQRVQQEQLGHRGRAADPLYGARKLLLLGAERVDDRGWERIHAVLRAGDPSDEVLGCWVAN